MNNLRQAAQQAIQAMKFVANPNEFAAVVADLEQALVEPEQESMPLNNGRLTQYPDGSIGVGKPAESEQPVGVAAPAPGADGFTAVFFLASQVPVGTKVYTAPTPSKPVGQLQEEAYGRGQVLWFKKPADQSMLYTDPPQRKPLTDEEIALISGECAASAHRRDDFSFARAIERKHGIGEQV